MDTFLLCDFKTEISSSTYTSRYAFTEESGDSPVYTSKKEFIHFFSRISKEYSFNLLSLSEFLGP